MGEVASAEATIGCGFGTGPADRSRPIRWWESGNSGEFGVREFGVSVTIPFDERHMFHFARKKELLL